MSQNFSFLNNKELKSLFSNSTTELKDILIKNFKYRRIPVYSLWFSYKEDIGNENFLRLEYIDSFITIYDAFEHWANIAWEDEDFQHCYNSVLIFNELNKLSGIGRYEIKRKKDPNFIGNDYLNNKKYEWKKVISDNGDIYYPELLCVKNIQNITVENIIDSSIQEIKKYYNELDYNKIKETCLIKFNNIKHKHQLNEQDLIDMGAILYEELKQ